MRAKGVHSFLDLHEKAVLALSDDRLVVIAIKADSPTSAENTAQRRRFGRAKRLSVAALTRLRKRFTNKFWELPEVLENFENLQKSIKISILAELPNQIRTALGAKREGNNKDEKTNL